MEDQRSSVCPIGSDIESGQETIYSNMVEPPPPCLGSIASMDARQAGEL
jgi:hypothetical protein